MRSATSAGSLREKGGTGVGSGIGLTPLGGGASRDGKGHREEVAGREPDTAVPQTRGMPPVTLFVALRAEQPLDDAAVERVSGGLRPGDEGLRIWRDGQDDALLRVSADCSADDLEAGLQLAHELAEETAVASPFPTEIEEVVAMDDEQQLVWRARA
jgi:hypothetical protein